MVQLPEGSSHLKAALSSVENLAKESFTFQGDPATGALTEATFNGIQVSVLLRTTKERIMDLEPLAEFAEQSQGESEQYSFCACFISRSKKGRLN